MSDVLIAAIAPTCDEAELETIVSQCYGLETSRVTLFTKDALLATPARSRMHFIPFKGSPIASSSHGTNVPGMDRTQALSSYFVDANKDHLKDTGISPDAAHYFNVAIDQGRGVVTYRTNAGNATLIEEQFRACGFVKIRRFARNRLEFADCM